MNLERWRRVDHVFGQALRLPLDERRSYLERTSADDPSLLHEALELLELEALEEGFLDQLPGSELATLRTLTEDDRGRRVGPFVLVERLGDGGTGVVYLGRRADGPEQQRVAVKILRRGQHSPAAVARFHREQAALARLAHDGIARFLDGGRLEDGRPYSILEHVEGRPIDEHCDQCRRSIEDRLRLFLAVCGIVSFVHRQLVVHRDLKPANVLVTPDGVPKLLDFGIAKDLAGEGSLTLTSARAMTPRYASPEQVAAKSAGIAGDVYALGVLLYELLSGRSPYRLQAESRFELEKAILERDPPRPSEALALPAVPGLGERRLEEIAELRRTSPKTLARHLRGDLDAIVLKALRKRPEERYCSVDDLARDVAAHLHHEPVAARQRSWLVALGKWTARHRGAAAVAAVVFLAAAIFVTQLYLQRERLEAERDRTRRALEVLVETFESPDPYGRGDTALTARDLLARAEARVRDGLRAEPALEAPLLRAIGRAYSGLGLLEEGDGLLARALELDEAAGAGRHAELADSLAARADLRQRQGRSREALELAARARLLLESEPGGNPRLFGEVLRFTAVLTEDLEQARPIYDEALRVLREAQGEQSVEAARVKGSLARAVGHAGQWEEADRLFLEATATMTRAVGEASPRLAALLTDQGLVLLEGGRVAEGRELLERAQRISERALGPDHPDVLAGRINLALARMNARDMAGAEAELRQLLPLVEAKWGEDSRQIATLLHNLAWAVFEQKRGAEAIELNRRALVIFRRVEGERSADVYASLRQLALALFYTERALPVALEHLEEAKRIAVELDGPVSPSVAKLALDFGQVAMEGGDLERAIPALRSALVLMERAFAAEHPSVLVARLELAKALARGGELGEAEGILRAACEPLPAQPPAEGIDAWRDALCRKRLVAFYEKWGKPELAARYRLAPGPAR